MTQSNSTVRLTASQAIVRYLVAQHSTRDEVSTRLIPGFVGIFGHGNTGGFGQAIGEYRKDAFFVEGRNEQGMAHIAAAFAKAARRDATLACTASIGPGSTNLITAAAGAYINRLPLLLLPADGYARRRPGTILQGLENPAAGDLSVNDCFRPVSRFFDRIMSPEQLLDSLPRAMRTLTDPIETGPVVLSVPQDVQVEAFDFPTYFFERREWAIGRPLPEHGPLSKAIEMLSQASRPLVVAGGGVLYSRAEEALLDFAEATGIPVAETLAGKGSIPADSPLAVGGLGVAGTTSANTLAAQADVVLCVGTRLSDYVTASQSIFQHSDVRFIGLNVNSADATKYGGHPLIADAREALTQMTGAVSSGRSSSSPAYATEVLELRQTWKGARERAMASEDAPPLRQTELVGMLNDTLESGDTLVTSAGTLPGDVFRYWDSRRDITCHIEFGYSCMGYDIAGAIGVKLAAPEGEVFALLGDGTFMLSPSDIAVAVQHRQKITVVLVDNQAMRSIYGLESKSVSEPYANVFRYRDPVTYELGEDVNFDMGQVGAGLGARVLKAATRDEFTSALAEARASDETCMIVVQSDVDRAPAVDKPWWDIAPAEVSDGGSADEFRRAYEEAARSQRFLY